MQRQTSEELTQALAAVTVDDAEFPEDFVVAEPFDEWSVGEVRRLHAAEAARDPDSVAVYEYDESRMFVATKLLEAAQPFVLIVLGTSVPKPTLTSAYRLYDAEESLAENASLAFQAFLERYAIWFTAGDRQVPFVPAIVKPAPKGQNISILDGLENDANDDFVANLVAKHEGTQMRIAWPFVVNTTVYRRDVARHHR